jgi:hypothetical protein
VNRPILYLTNASTVNAVRSVRRAATEASQACVGQGRALSIMAEPRAQYGETGEGRVPVLEPGHELFRAMKGHMIDGDVYRSEYIRQVEEVLASGRLAPGVLVANLGGPMEALVEAGDTLMCACSRDNARAGRCHRVWAAEILERAGWRCILDGRELGGGHG